jgi:hypothetical protein
MKTDRLLTDVNLSSIAFATAGSGIDLTFLNMRDGQEAGIISFSGLILFNYHAPEGALPEYVGEVNHAVVPSDEVLPLLDRLHYGFTVSLGAKARPKGSEVHYIHIEGALIVDIVCEVIRFAR